MAQIGKLPSGFVIDKPEPGVPLPSGFKVDEPQQSKEKADENNPEWRYAATHQGRTQDEVVNLPETDKPVDKPHEPDTLWGGRMKGVVDYGKDLMIGQLKGMAQPQTAGDFGSLLMVGDVPNEFAAAKELGGRAKVAMQKTANEPWTFGRAAAGVGTHGVTEAARATRNFYRDLPSQLEKQAAKFRGPAEEGPMHGPENAPIPPKDSLYESYKKNREKPAKTAKDTTTIVPQKPAGDINLPPETPFKVGPLEDLLKKADKVDKEGGKHNLTLDKNQSKPQTSIPVEGVGKKTTSPESDFDAAIKKVTEDLKGGEENPPLRSKNVKAQSQRKGNIVSDERGMVGKNINDTRTIDTEGVSNRIQEKVRNNKLSDDEAITQLEKVHGQPRVNLVHDPSQVGVLNGLKKERNGRNYVSVDYAYKREWVPEDQIGQQVKLPDSSSKLKVNLP